MPILTFQNWRGRSVEAGGAGYLLRKNGRVIGYILERYLKPFGRIDLLLIAPSRRTGAAPMYCLDFYRQSAPHPERLFGKKLGICF